MGGGALWPDVTHDSADGAVPSCRRDGGGCLCSRSLSEGWANLAHSTCVHAQTVCHSLVVGVTCLQDISVV